MPDPSRPFGLEFSTGVADVFAKVQRMVVDARQWTYSGKFMELYDFGGDMEKYRATYDDLVDKVDDMELSWWRGIQTLIRFASNSGGVQIMKDSDHGLLFLEPRTGLHGGLIPHFTYVGEHITPLCSWSLHT